MTITDMISVFDIRQRKGFLMFAENRYKLDFHVRLLVSNYEFRISAQTTLKISTKIRLDF